MIYLNHKFNKSFNCDYCNKHYSKIVLELTNEELALEDKVILLQDILMINIWT